jgi:hypothetical protein
MSTYFQQYFSQFWNIDFFEVSRYPPFLRATPLKYPGISPQVSSIEYDLIDSAENYTYGVVFDADHESGLGF